MRLILIGIFLLLTFFANTQSKVDSLILEKVNDLRDSLGLNQLVFDQSLIDAASDHAYYLSKKRKLTHFQTVYNKETPEDRVVYYNGTRTYIGENVASLNINPKKLSDELIANEFFNSWLYSPPHYQNMINSTYTHIGISLLNRTNSEIYGVQVFSSKEITLPNSFVNTQDAWGVRPSEKTCKDDEHVYETMFFANYVQTVGNEIYMVFYDIAFFKGVIANDNDGLAIDVVLREQFPCDKENQFHPSTIYDGEMQRPIYKNDLFRHNLSLNPKKIKVKIGEVPSHLKGKQWDANVIIVNNNKLCDYAVPVEVPSGVFPLLKLKPYIEDLAFIKEDSTQFASFSEVKIKDTIHVVLDYERSKKSFKSIDYFEYNKLIDYHDYAKKIQVNTYASVEGKTWMNEKLVQERENVSKNILREAGFSFNNITFKSGENWELMNQQVKDNNLDQLRGKSQNQIKNYLKNNKTPFFDSLLYEQRKTHIYAYIDTTINIDSYRDYKFSQFYEEINDTNFSQLPWNTILREEYIERNKGLERHLIDSLLVTDEIKTNYLGALYLSRVNLSTDSAYVAGTLSGIYDTNSSQIANYILVLTQYWFNQYTNVAEVDRIMAKTESPEDLFDLIEKLDTSVVKEEAINVLKLNVVLSGIYYYVDHNQWDKVNDYFDLIVAIVELNDLTPTEAMELALFCNYFHKFDQSVKILDKYFHRDILTEDGLFVLAKTATLIRQKLNVDDYHAYMLGAKFSNSLRYCDWIDRSFQIMRDEFIKKDFCKSCMSKYR